MTEHCYMCGRKLPTFIVWKPGEAQPVGWHWTNLPPDSGRSTPFQKPICDLCEPYPAAAAALRAFDWSI